MTEYSEGYQHLIAVANDLESLGHTSVSTEQLKNIAWHLETEMIKINSGFDQVETIEDFNT